MADAPTNEASVELSDLRFSWRRGPTVLSVAGLSIGAGERLFLAGPSGSGKSSLLGIIAGVYEPEAGEVRVAGQSLRQLGARQRDRLRAREMGVIFQLFNLVPYLSIVDNVLLPCRFSRLRGDRVGPSRHDRHRAAFDLLVRLGLEHEAAEDRPASDLSVGQQQRVAAARALIGSPSLIIADEPTSALDSDTKDAFIDTLLSEAGDATVLFVSHDASLATMFDRTVFMADINAAAPDRDNGAA